MASDRKKELFYRRQRSKRGNSVIVHVKVNLLVMESTIQPVKIVIISSVSLGGAEKITLMMSLRLCVINAWSPSPS